MRVLLVSPRFFGYEQVIAGELRRQGHGVRFLDERPSNAALMRAVFRTAPWLARRRLRRYFDRAAADLDGQRIDVVLVIKGESVATSLLEHLRRANPACVMVLYTYDSLANSPRAAEIRPYFDIAYSFDAGDVARDGRFRHKALFYSEDFAALRGKPRRYDLAFIGTMHSNRFRIVQELMACVERPFTFFHVQALWYYIVKKLTDRRWRTVGKADVNFGRLSLSEVAEVFASSRAVVDVQRDGQRGLTMRTFEVLAAGAGLVTTNSAIRDTELYDPGSVYVVEPGRGSENGLAAWLNSCRPMPIRVLQKHSIESWVGDLLNDVRALP